MYNEKTIYFHIGSPKTGTTSIQRFFFENKVALKNQYNIDYPILSSDSFREITNGKYLDRPDLFSKFISVVDSSNCSRILISEESLFLYKDINFFKRKEFEKYKLIFIVYLRNSFDYLSSLWGEMAKVYNRDENYISLEGYLKKNSYKESLNYLLELSQYFGKENIIVKSFEKESFTNTSLIEDFLSIFDINSNKDFIYSAEQNMSVSRKECDIVTFLKPTFKLINYSQNDIEILIEALEGGDVKIAETISDVTIKKICDETSPIEVVIENELCGGKKLFINKYPKVYGKKRLKYSPISLKGKLIILHFIRMKMKLENIPLSSIGFRQNLDLGWAYSKLFFENFKHSVNRLF